MKTMGIEDLWLVAPKQPAPQFESEAIALASGAFDVLQRARVVPTLQEAIADTTLAIAFTARKRELSHRHLALREAATEALGHLRSQAEAQVALVFGNEAMCLSNEQVAYCQLLASVPANPVYSSLNLAQTVQVAAYEMMMATADFIVTADTPRPLANVGEVEALVQHLERAAIESGFLDPNSPKRFGTRMRRLFTRAQLEPEEVAILRGVLASFEASFQERLQKLSEVASGAPQPSPQGLTASKPR
jgi:tRNA/rRNA methyltransferase